MGLGEAHKRNWKFFLLDLCGRKTSTTSGTVRLNIDMVASKINSSHGQLVPAILVKFNNATASCDFFTGRPTRMKFKACRL